MSAVVTIIGNLGNEPEARMLASGANVTDISVAVNLGKDKQPNWYKCSIFGKSGEYAANNLHKGSKVAVTGRLVANESNGKTYLNVTAYEVQSLSKQQTAESDDDFVPF